MAIFSSRCFSWYTLRHKHTYKPTTTHTDTQKHTLTKALTQTHTHSVLHAPPAPPPFPHANMFEFPFASFLYIYMYAHACIYVSRTEEIGLKMITTANISNMLLRESSYISNKPPNCQTSFHVSKRSLRHSKDLPRNRADLEI